MFNCFVLSYCTTVLAENVSTSSNNGQNEERSHPEYSLLMSKFKKKMTKYFKESKVRHKPIPCSGMLRKLRRHFLQTLWNTIMKVSFLKGQYSRILILKYQYSAFTPTLKKYICPILWREIGIGEAVRIGSMIILHLSKRWKANLFILCDVIFLVRLQGKLYIDHSWESMG